LVDRYKPTEHVEVDLPSVPALWYHLSYRVALVKENKKMAEGTRVVDILAPRVDLDELRTQIQYLEGKLSQTQPDSLDANNLEGILNLLETMIDTGERVI
jgi:hypothetical protein